MSPAPPPPPAVAAPAPAPRLDQQRGRHRVVLVFAPSEEDARLRYQTSELRRLTKGPDTRDLVQVTVAGGRVEGASDPSAGLRERFHVVLGGYRTFLIGEDGHRALTSSSPIPAEEIARAVDAMPMRQASRASERPVSSARSRP